MSTLDDAREGMDLSVRPQDDLFGHVNGRWLETAEIPADKGGWGPFMMLADAAESQVRGDHRGAGRAGRRRRAGPRRRRDAGSPACTRRSWTRARVEALGTQPIQPLLDAVASLRDVRDLAAFLGEFEQIGGSGLFGVYVDSDAKDSDR